MSDSINFPYYYFYRKIGSSNERLIYDAINAI